MLLDILKEALAENFYQKSISNKREEIKFKAKLKSNRKNSNYTPPKKKRK